MIGFSRPCRIFSCMLSRQVQLNKSSSRFFTSYKMNFKGIDKINWMNKKQQKLSDNPAGVFSLIFPLACFGLAIWQFDRKRWKAILIEDLRMRMYIPAVDIPENLTDRVKMEYRKVKARGTFDHSKEMYIGPRSLLLDGKFSESQPLFSFGKQKEPSIGFMVVTPFKLADRNVSILVNRGWVPMNKQDPSTRLEAQIEDEIEIEGIVRLKENEPSFLQKGANPRDFRHRDLEMMAELAGTSQFFIDAVEESSVPGGPIGGQTYVNVKDDHLQYMITWTILGLYTSYMWHKRWIRKLQ